jgi:hypothetical protein
MTFKGHRASSNSQILFPAFYRGSQYFDGLLIPRDSASCVITVDKIIGENRLPIFFSANLINSQIIGALYKGFGDLSNRLDDSSIIKKAVLK